MKTLLLTITFFQCLTLLFGQSSAKRVKLYDARIMLANGKLDHKTNLYLLTDSALFVTSRPILKSEILNYDYSTNRKLLIEDIETIKVRHRNSVGRGFLYGALSGLVLGALVGTIWQGTDESFTGLYYAFGIAFTMVPSSLIGGALGSINRKFHINQDFNNYQQARPKLADYTITHSLNTE